MRKFLSWLKKYSLWILGGVIALLGIIFAVRHERDKLKQFKADKEIEKNKIEVAKLQGVREQVLKHEGALARKDATLAVDVEALDKKIASLAEEREKIAENTTKPKSAKEVSKTFNQRYRGRKRKK